MTANDISVMLWHERQLLDYLILKLEEGQHLLAIGETQLLPRMIGELEKAVNDLPLTQLALDVELAACAPGWGIHPHATLRELADQAPASPWGEIFSAHLSAMTAQTERIRGLREANEDALQSLADQIEKELASVYGRTQTTHGQREDRAALALTLEMEKTNCQRALVITARTLPWTLTEFLG